MARKYPTFDEFFTSVYLPYAKLRKRSWRTDAQIETKRVSPRFGHQRISEIAAADVEQWLNSLLDAGYAPASCNRFLALLKTVLALAASHGLISNLLAGTYSHSGIQASVSAIFQKRKPPG